MHCDHMLLLCLCVLSSRGEVVASGHDLHSLLLAYLHKATCPAPVVLGLLLLLLLLLFVCREVTASGHDLHSLLFAYLDELLFIYATEYIMFGAITITRLDLDTFSVTATG